MEYTDESPENIVVPSKIFCDWKVRLDVDENDQGWESVHAVMREMHSWVERS